MVHQPRDDEGIGYRIGEFTDAHAVGQRPVDLHAEARVAAVFPIAVPVGIGLHDERECRHPAGRGAHGFGLD